MDASNLLLLVWLTMSMTVLVYCEDPCEPLDKIQNYTQLGTPCGENQCLCLNATATCYGRIGQMTYNALPTLGKNIRHISAICYNFANLSTDSFVKIKSKAIQKLNLTRCYMESVQIDTFSGFRQLQVLLINHNEFVNQTQLFQAVETLKGSLTNLTLSVINLEKMDVEYFSRFPKLKYLDLTGNKIDLLQGNTPIGNLEHLNLSRNYFHGKHLHFCINATSKTGSRIRGDSSREKKQALLPELRVLDLGRNYLGGNGKAIIDKFECLEKLEFLDLNNNTIGEIKLPIFQNLSNLNTLILSFNWLKKVSTGKIPYKLEYMDFRDNQFSPFPPKLCKPGYNMTFPNMKYLDFGRNYIQNLTTNWHLCMPNIEWMDFGKNDVRRIRNDTFIQYKNLKHLFLANLIPWEKALEPRAFKSDSLQSLSLRYNWMNFSSSESLKSMFQFCPNLTWLDLSYNYIECPYVLNQTINPLKKLEHLRLEKVHLYPFPFFVLTSFPQLKELNVNRNTIYTIFFNDAFNSSDLKLNIERISAASCYIHTVNGSTFPSSIRKSLKYLDLSDNQLRCDCGNRWFRDALDQSTGMIKDSKVELVNWKTKYLCRSPAKLGGHMFWTYQPVERCTYLSAMFVAFIAAGCTLFVFSVLTAVGFWNRWYIKYWFYKLGRKRQTEDHDDPENTALLGSERYDGYVVYNNDDHMFVHHAFRELVENELGYKLHIWERDADNGASVDVVLDAMYASRHVIVAVSNNILKDPWAKFQVDVALDKSIKANSDVLFVKLDNLNPLRISKTWCILLTRTPTVEWSGDTESIESKLLKETIRKRLGRPLNRNSVN